VIDGALLLDKPVGITSNRALQDAKRIFQVKKAGHAGTLDPLASGLLLVLFGEATKFAGLLLDAEKEYLATVRLGERTSTADAEGEVLERKEIPAAIENAVPSVLGRFKGEIEQVPPMHSALKRDGVPLYKLARKGQNVARAPRRIRIAALDLVAFRSPLMELRVRCSKGTYIRTLAEDIGVALGTAAHLAALRRTASGAFRVEEAIRLDALGQLSEAERRGRLLPLGALLGDLPRTELDAAAEGRFRNGQVLALPMPEGLCAVYGHNGVVVGLGRADAAGKLRPVRLTAAQDAE
jgi:tRNA pseudouridine55 synthase